SVTTYVTVKPAPNVLLWIVFLLIIIVIIIGVIAAVRRHRGYGVSNNRGAVGGFSTGGSYQGRLVSFELLCSGDGRCVEVELI
ncbi:MAG: S-layer protein, partial [Vulcanisaeta sp.]|nr:S-layer protein [Vulcanisaeta sp.]MCG2887446.1 S-layer protein [Vulcanisaeta sp.]